MNATHARQIALQIQRAIGQRNWPAAEAGLAALESLAPADAWVRIQQSYVQSWQGHYRRAHALAMQAANLAPPDAETISDVAWRLRTFNELQALENYVRRLGDPAAIPLEVLPDIAAQLSQLNRFEQARELLEIAHTRVPSHPAITVALAQSHSYLGAFDRARVLILEAIESAPEFAQAWWQLATLPDDGCAGQYAAQVQSLLSAGSAKDPATLEFALHRFLDMTKDYDEAGRALVEACRLKHDAKRVAAQAVGECVDALIAWRPASAQTARASETTVTPIFVLGMHRSGTTLLEQLLSGHPNVEGGGEMYDFTAAMREATDYHCKGVLDLPLIERAKTLDFPSVGDAYVSGVVAKLQARSHFTDKLPTNFFNLGFMLEALPNARILHLVRDPMEVCFSNLRELFAEVNFHTYDADSMAGYYADYLRLMAHWKSRYPGRILDVHYEKLTRDTEATMREVSQYCGLAFDASTLSTASNPSRGVATASVAQVRNEVTARREPKWKPYSAVLKDMADALTRRGIEFET